jgi:hypothetical protein
MTNLNDDYAQLRGSGLVGCRLMDSVSLGGVLSIRQGFSDSKK